MKDEDPGGCRWGLLLCATLPVREQDEVLKSVSAGSYAT